MKKLMVLLVVALSQACANTATCDPDEMLVDDLCLPLPPIPEAGAPDAGLRDAAALTARDGGREARSDAGSLGERN